MVELIGRYNLEMKGSFSMTLLTINILQIIGRQNLKINIEL